MVMFIIFMVSAFAQKDVCTEWLVARTDTLINYLIACVRQLPEVREKAVQHKQLTKIMKPLIARRTVSYHDLEASEGGVIIPPPFPYSRPPVLYVQTPSNSFQSAFTLGDPLSSQSGLTTYIQSTSFH